MKKLLLLSTGVAFALSVQAQSSRIIKMDNSKSYLNRGQAIETPGANFQRSPYVRPVHTTGIYHRTAGTPVAAKNACGNSANVLGSIVSKSNNVNANQDLGVVVFSHRACSEYVTAGTAYNGEFQATWATDCSSWDSSHVVVGHTTEPIPAFLRYPTGSIYNPSGNLTIGNAVAIGSGPYHLGPAASWAGTYFVATHLDGTGDQFQIQAGQNYAFGRNGSYVTDNGVYYVLGNHYDDQNAPTVILGFPISKAVYDAGTGSLTVTQSEISNAGLDEGDDGMFAFNNDGTVGYFAVMARDTTASGPNYVSRQPIIWKTTDAGATWNREPVINFSAACGMSDILGNDTLPDGTTRPFWGASDGFDMTIDKNGNLHILSLVFAAADDADMIYNTQHIVDVYGQGNVWAAAEIGILQTTQVTADISPWIDQNGAGIAWDGRLQIGRTHDGSRVFYGWIDSDPSIAAENLFPDIHVAGMNVDTYFTTDNINVTAGTQFAENNLFMYLSSTILSDGAGNYNIPMTTTDSRDPNAPGAATVQHFSVCGVSLSEPDFINQQCNITGIVENNGIKGVSISQNYPNPFNGTTAIEVKAASPVVVSLEVTNYLGQVVKTMDAKNYAAGTHKIEINASDLHAGVYFYTIKVGNEQATGKMIIQ